MREKKIYIILIAIVVIFFIVMFLVFGLDEIKKSGYDTVMIVGEDTIFTYKNKRWSSTTSHKDLNWKKYDVYSNNEKSGNYYLWYNDKWYAFDDDKKAVKLDGELLAIDSNIDIKVYNFSTEKIEDYSYVNEVLKDNDITDDEYTVNKVIRLDYDNDGVEEEFYIVSNSFPMGFNPKKIFSIVFMVKDEKIYSIYKNVTDNTGFNGCRPYISNFIDVDNDNKYEFLLNCSKYSVSGVTRMLYKFKDKEFKILISDNN